MIVRWPAAFMLAKPLGGCGLLLGGVPGVAAGKVMVIGGGSGPERGRISVGLGGEPTSTTARSTACASSRSCSTGGCRRASPRPWRSSRACPRSTSSSAPCSCRGHGAARDHARAARAHEAGRGAGRRLDRPGRLLRDLAPDHALQPDLRGRRDHPLLRGQHARRGSRSPRPGADQRHLPYLAQARRPGSHRALGADPGSSRASTSPPASSPTSRSRATRVSSTRPADALAAVPTA